MPILLILLVATVIEVAVLVAVGNAIGVLPTIGLLILASVVGAWLLRREGTRALRAFTEAARTRRPPHRELADGVLIAAAGILIVLPGFVSDVLALMLLLPPTRAMVRGRMLRSASRRTASMPSGVRFGPAGVRFATGGVGDTGVRDSGVRDGGSRDGAMRDGGVVDGEVVPESEPGGPVHRQLPPDPEPRG